MIFDPVLGVFSSLSINVMASTDIDSHGLTSSVNASIRHTALILVSAFQALEPLVDFLAPKIISNTTEAALGNEQGDNILGGKLADPVDDDYSLMKSIA